jgi:hypothetical protein
MGKEQSIATKLYLRKSSGVPSTVTIDKNNVLCISEN